MDIRKQLDQLIRKDLTAEDYREGDARAAESDKIMAASFKRRIPEIKQKMKDLQNFISEFYSLSEREYYLEHPTGQAFEAFTELLEEDIRQFEKYTE